MASATNSGRGGGGPQTGHKGPGGASAGEHGGNRGPQDKGGKSGSGPRTGHQSHGADPHRGQPG